ncbi:hypothetical protein ACOSQ3_012112 [Xanthoceras sorbifolium]
MSTSHQHNWCPTVIGPYYPYVLCGISWAIRIPPPGRYVIVTISDRMGRGRIISQRGSHLEALFFQQVLEGSVVLCRRRLGALDSHRQRKVFSRDVCSSLFHKAKYPFSFRVQPPADSDGEDLEEEPLICHLSLKGKGKATPEDGKFPDSAVVGDDEIAAIPYGEKGVGTFARSVGGGKGVSDPCPSEP